jgi:hypothetical protein
MHTTRPQPSQAKSPLRPRAAMRLLGLSLVAAALAAACGGTAIIDPGGSGGANAGSTSASSGTSSSFASSSQSTSSGSMGGCGVDRPCPAGQTCLWGQGRDGQGVCAPLCQEGSCGEDVCPAGSVCDSCASSSCPECADCIGACRPTRAGQCDGHDDCGEDELCNYSQGRCAKACGSTAECDADAICDGCATSSCPCCEDCRGICIGTG